MGTELMVQTTADFFKKIDNIEKSLRTFSGNISERKEKVFQKLDDFIKESLCGENISQSHQNNDVDECLNEALRMMREAIQDWGEAIKKNRKGFEFMNKNEKYLLAMVFGQVNTGKSSLGNFLAGKQFRTAIFDNEFKRRCDSGLVPSFAVENQGRAGNMDKGWFSEGNIDTTGAIQYFTLSGLRWIDSPGTGALGKTGDTCDMEKLVNEYLDYVDLGIFLMSSDEPGLQPDFAYVEKLQKKGKSAVILITKSDYNDEDLDEDGNLIDYWCAKKQVDRDEQEKWIRDNLVTKSCENTFRVISISTYLAARAIKEANDGLFQQSNLDEFMKLLAEKASEEAIELKEKNPKQNVNNFIDDIINGYDGVRGEERFKGIVDLGNMMHAVPELVKEYQKKIERLKTTLVPTVNSKANMAIQGRAREWAAQVEAGKPEVTPQEISQTITWMITDVLEQELNYAVGDIIDNFQDQKLQMEMKIAAPGINKKQEYIEHRYTRRFAVERDADGAWETFRGWCGKKFYKMQHEECVERRSVDVGTNLQDVLDMIKPEVEKAVQENVDKVLCQLSATYFQPQTEYAMRVGKKLEALRRELESLKFGK